ncbi:STAS domain-containing protein [Actinomadura alba]|uniref:Anti-sigma factor antagonist n=1 Tax=Actinomadura alba TaxID=406431 RepID=A0ABR7M2F5_9ACTN|nr:STAS domain-containing protein [Actinomadura alba]MBC6471286.1 STAS domain-containing protein [Actinomadura alba]
MHRDDLNVSLARTSGAAAIVTVTGELNLFTSERLSPATQAAAGDHTHVVLDLSAVPFCDSSGLNALIILYRSLHGAGGSLSLAAVPERLMRLLHTTGVQRLIPTYPTIDQAVERVPQSRDSNGSGGDGPDSNGREQAGPVAD